jgi:hypothetical protein
MVALTTQQEYDAIREAIQQLSTLSGTGERRDTVSVSVEGMSLTYSSAQMPQLQDREKELARRLTIRNVRKRTISTFDGGYTRDY